MLPVVRCRPPTAYDAFLGYRMNVNAPLISATGLGVICLMLAGEVVDQPSSGLSPREWRELMVLLELDTGR
jgi:thymidylate synthase (FAD)